MNTTPAKNSLSILMPTYNNVCVELVECLSAQCEKIAERASCGFWFEIVVADDGSTDTASLCENRRINAIQHCRFIERGVNRGRSCIRNFLARESKGIWLLFIDSDVAVDNASFIAKYLEQKAQTVICGGVHIRPGVKALSHNLRYRYESAEAHKHTAEARAKAEHKCFRTTNFMARKDIMQRFAFDEAITAYGYEDVLFGKLLRENDIAVTHIDNPVTLVDYEDNGRFVAKTEESLRTLFQFRHKLSGYSNMLGFIDRSARLGLLAAFLSWHRLMATWERKNLMGQNPSLLVFKLYKIGYYMSLK